MLEVPPTATAALIARLSKIKFIKLVSIHELPAGECGCGGQRKVNDWARGSRSGVWLCKVCKRPSPFWRKGVPDRITSVIGNDIKDTVI